MIDWLSYVWDAITAGLAWLPDECSSVLASIGACATAIVSVKLILLVKDGLSANG